MDSGMYFLSGEERCVKCIPADSVISTNRTFESDWAVNKGGIFREPIAIPERLFRKDLRRIISIKPGGDMPGRQRRTKMRKAFACRREPFIFLLRRIQCHSTPGIELQVKICSGLAWA